MKTSVKLWALVPLFACIHSAAGLQCLVCADSSCSSQTSQSCSSETLCFSFAYAGSDSNGRYSGIQKGCAPASVCTAAGSQFVSYEVGSRSYLRNLICCETDDCNAPNPYPPPVGSLQCYSCDPGSYECNSNVTCNAQEICSQTIVTDSNGVRHLIYGCVSENLCNNTSLSQQYFSFSSPVSCCNTSHCNFPSLQCMSGSGSEQHLVNCSSQTAACFSLTYTASYTYGNYSVTSTSTNKGCASASDCTAAGSEFISYNYGPYAYDINTTCCDTDNCNQENLSITVPPVGSLKCYSCDPFSYECTANVSCNTQEVCGETVDFLTGDQDNSSRPFYGCVSENLCNNTRLAQQYIGFSSPVSCCNTSHCNLPDLGLQCMTCTDSSCSSQRSVTCSKLSPFCYSWGYAGSNSNGSYSGIQKGCAPASVCTAAGSRFVSYEFGSSSYLRNLICCETDDCNAPNPYPPPAGSLQCYSCETNTSECSTNVTCNVLETCFNTSAGNYSLYGCVSANLCENLSCCNTSYCNIPSTTTQAPPTTTTQAPPTTTTQAPPTTTTEAPPTTTTGAVQVVALAPLLSVLLLCVHMCNF